MKKRRELLMVSKTGMVLILKIEESLRPPSTLNPGQKHAVKNQKAGRHQVLCDPGRDEAHRRPGRHDRHDGQDYKYAATQVTIDAGLQRYLKKMKIPQKRKSRKYVQLNYHLNLFFAPCP